MTSTRNGGVASPASASRGVRRISDVAEGLGVNSEDVLPYGRDMAKVELRAFERERRRERPARLILVSAITPTPAGEGKTTTSIGLADAFARLGESVCLALREPSLGPAFGMKGGATGGGASTLTPSERINLHFTGDFHAITSAHNFLAALIDNHIHFRKEPVLDPRRIVWPRVMDMNDRALRGVIVGLGGPLQGVPRESSFDITAASEVMAMLCLAEDFEDLRSRINRTLIGFTPERAPVTAGELGAAGPMLALLRDALMPNLVQTQEGTPAFVHGGPFANIAHGCNSVLATRMAMHHADWVVTEAGFGFDLGAEKFFDIKCRSAGLDTAAVVLVATVRALKMHGGRSVKELETPDPDAVEKGLENLAKHIESVRHLEEIPIVCLNRFAADTDDELRVVTSFCERLGVPCAVSSHFADGGAGALDLARAVIEHAEKTPSPYRPVYELEASVPDKIRAVAQAIYGARDVAFTAPALKELARIERLGYAKLPICIAKTQNSLSDDPKRRGRPSDFEITIRSIQINAGAGFLVVLTGDIMRMPGLPRVPRGLSIDVKDGEIIGVR